MNFHSRVDAFNILEYIISLLIVCTPFIFFGFVIWYFCVVLVVAILMTIVLFNTSYKLQENEIKIKNGLSSFFVPYDAIKGVSKVKSFKNSSSTSVKCIEIEYTKQIRLVGNKLYISPLREDEFLLKLIEKCEKHIEIKDKRSKGDKNH